MMRSLRACATLASATIIGGCELLGLSPCAGSMSLDCRFRFNIEPPSLCPGQPATVSGRPLSPGESLDVYIRLSKEPAGSLISDAGQFVGTVVGDENRNFSLTFTVPEAPGAEHYYLMLTNSGRTAYTSGRLGTSCE